MWLVSSVIVIWFTWQNVTIAALLHFPAKRCTCSQPRLWALRLFKILFQAHSSVRPLVLYLSVHFHTFRLLSFRFFIRPSIGASVPAFFRPSVRFSLCPFIGQYVQPFFRSSVRAFDVRFVRCSFSCVPVCFAFIYPFVFSSVLSFAFDG